MDKVCKDKKNRTFELLLEMYRSRYEKSHNPMNVWECIIEIESSSLLKDKYYPGWIRNYLTQVAEELMRLSLETKSDTDITAALGFSDLREHSKPDGTKTFIALMFMDEMVNDGKSREEAALAAENYLKEIGLQNKFDEKKRGYLGPSKLEKLYREFVRIKKDFCQESQIEGEEESNRQNPSG